MAALYNQILSTPFKDVKSYWEPFMAFASQQTVQVLASPDELGMLESAFAEDVSNHMCRCTSKSNYLILSTKNSSIQITFLHFQAIDV